MAKLGNVCKFQSGGTPAKGDPTYYGGKIPWITTVALNGGIIGNESAIEWITEKALRESAAKLVPAYSIMIGTRVGVGKVAINREEMSTSQDIISLIGINDTRWNKPYLCRFLQAKSDFLNAQARGATIKGIKIEVLSELDIPEITLVEQQRVADIFDKLSTLILKRQEQLRQMDLLVKSRFIELFGDPQRNPHGYKHTKLSDIATYYNGLTYKPENVAAEGTIVLRSSNIQNSQLDFADTVRVDCAIKERLMVQKNDILMCSRNGSAKLVGKVALIKDIQEPMSFGAFMMIIRSHYFGYLMTYFQMDAFRQQIKTGATTTINQITGRMLDDVTMPLPPMSLVDQFATFVEQTDKSKFRIQKSLSTSRKLWTMAQIDAIMNMDFSTQRSL